MLGGAHWESLLAKEGKRKHYDKRCHRKQRGKYQKVGKHMSRINQASFSKEGIVSSYGAQKSRKFFKGKNNFLRSLEKQKRCHNSKEATFDLVRAQFLIMKEELNLEIIPHGPTC